MGQGSWRDKKLRDAHICALLPGDEKKCFPTLILGALLQSLQKILPQHRQWCFLLVAVKICLHLSQVLACFSAIQAIAATPVLQQCPPFIFASVIACLQDLPIIPTSAMSTLRAHTKQGVDNGGNQENNSVNVKNVFPGPYALSINGKIRERTNVMKMLGVEEWQRFFGVSTWPHRRMCT